MNKHKKAPLIIHIQHELAYEIISVSVIIILLGITFLTASNLLRFNWYTVIFFILTMGMIYLKWANQLRIKDDQLLISYYRTSAQINIDMHSIQEIVFYKYKRNVEIKTNSGEVIQVFMRLKNQKKLLNYIFQHYPEVKCMFQSK